MRVLFYTWPGAFDCRGGGELQLLNYEQGLKERGIEVVRFDQWQPNFHDIDLVHVFSSQPGIRAFTDFIRSKNIPIAYSPIFWPDDKKNINFNEILGILENSAVILPNSKIECQEIAAVFRVSDRKFTAIPNGVASVFFEQVSGEVFREKYGIEGDFLLTVGNIEPRKNQFRLIKALSGTNVQLVLAGNVRNAEYAEKCRRIAGENVHFIGPLENGSIMHRSAYAACKLFVLPSLLETPGLVALEAGASGAPLLLTNRGCTVEYFKNYASYIDPFDELSIRSGVLNNFNKERSSKTSSFIRENYVWDRAIEKLVQVYQKAISSGGDSNDASKCSLLQERENEIGVPFNFEGEEVYSSYFHLSNEVEKISYSKRAYMPKGIYQLAIRCSLWGYNRPAVLEVYDGKDLISKLEIKGCLDEEIVQDLRLRSDAKEFYLKLVFPFGVAFNLISVAIRCDHSVLLDKRIFTDIVASGKGLYEIPNELFLVDGKRGRPLIFHPEGCVHVIHGPYVALKSGNYTCVVLNQYKNEQNIPIKLELKANFGNLTLAEKQLKTNVEVVDFHLSEDIAGLEASTEVPVNSWYWQQRLLLQRESPSAEDWRIDPFNTESLNVLEKSGWHTPEPSGVWMSQNNAELLLLCGFPASSVELQVEPYLKKDRDFLDLDIKVREESKKFRLHAGDNFLKISCAKAAKLVPMQLRISDELVSPLIDRNGEDARVLGVKVKRLLLNGLSAIKNNLSIQPFNTEDENLLVHDGWHQSEPSGVWTSQKVSELVICSAFSVATIEMVIEPYLRHRTDFMDLRVQINEETNWFRLSSGDNCIEINRTESSRLMSIKFIVNDELISPLDEGKGEDGRKLGIKLKKLNLK